ncbi:MAG: hypothetical protein Q7K57_06580 [Burkholderiaceae bacterium]|nr:hypothetical protein [Burkholderiaceae bacterium]
MKHRSIYSTLAKTALWAGLVTGALAGATLAQARPYYVQDAPIVQGGAQLVVTTPQLVVTPPQLAVQAVVVQPAPPVYVRPVVRHRPVVYAPVAVPVYRYRPDRIYYVHGRPFINGHPYYRQHGYDRHHERRQWRHHGRHDEGRHVGRDR